MLQIFIQAVLLCFAGLEISLQLCKLCSLFLQTFLKLFLFLAQDIYSMASALHFFWLPFLFHLGWLDLEWDLIVLDPCLLLQTFDSH